MTDKTTKHLMKLFELKPGEGSTIQECERVISKPILLFDSILEVWEDVKTYSYIGKEKAHFKELEKAIRLYNSSVFFTLTMEEKTELADNMSDFTDYIATKRTQLEQSFHSCLMNKYESSEIRIIICKLYLVSVLSQCIYLYFKHLKQGARDTLMMDFMKTAIYRVKRLQDLIDKRGDKSDSYFDPNTNEKVATAIKAFVNSFFSYSAA